MLKINETFKLNEWRGNTNIIKGVVSEFVSDAAIVDLYKPSGFANVGPVWCGMVYIKIDQSHRCARKDIIKNIYNMKWID